MPAASASCRNFYSFVVVWYPCIWTDFCARWTLWELESSASEAPSPVPGAGQVGRLRVYTAYGLSNLFSFVSKACAIVV